jgi:lipid-binding SYLF domain-containing protein
MKRLQTPFGASLVLLILTGMPLRAGSRELVTVDLAAETVKDLATLPSKCIPPALLREGKGVAILPRVVKAGLVVGGRVGRGVVLVRLPDGTWSNPVFVALAGGSIGGQAGIQSTDLVLVFKTSHSLDRILRGQGKLTLGGDVAVAAGPVGRQAEAATDVLLRAEIYSYSRSRGLFAGLSLEGAALLADCAANEAFYGVRGGRPMDVLARRGVPIPAAVVHLQGELSRLSPPPNPPAILLPPQAVPLPPPPPPRPTP